MMSLRGDRLIEFAIPTGTVWLMTDIAEAKGRHDLYTKQSPQVLEALREMALGGADPGQPGGARARHNNKGNKLKRG